MMLKRTGWPSARPRDYWMLAFAIVFALLMGSLQGCTAIGGGAAPRNTNEAILESKALAKAYTLSIQSLANRCVQGVAPNCRRYAISRARALEQLDHLAKVERDLRAALAVVTATGDPMAGGDVLARINSTLTLVLTFLASQEQ